MWVGFVGYSGLGGDVGIKFLMIRFEFCKSLDRVFRGRRSL